MKVCTTYGTDVPLRKGADMHEIRLDVFSKVPGGIGESDVITLCGKDISNVPDGFRGLVDVGDSLIETGFRKIRSIHDFDKTPDAGEIVKMLSEGDQEISKGAFMASSFSDIHSIYTASKEIGRKHVLLGMGEMGEITRIRQSILGNEFTFGYHGESTAPGQFSVDEMESFGDDCQIAGVTGHPLQCGDQESRYQCDLPEIRFTKPEQCMRCDPRVRHQRDECNDPVQTGHLQIIG